MADEVRRDNILTMTRFMQGDMGAVETHLRRGIKGSDRLRLPVTRVQLRWVEAALAQWQGQLDLAEALATTAHQRHLQTELYGADRTYVHARLALSWDRGRLSEEPDTISRSPEPLVWGALAAAETGDREVGQELLSRGFDPDEPEYWYTLARLTLMAHAAADLGDVSVARPLLERLAANTWAVAAFGQAGSIGPVALATGRLRALLGDPVAARADFSQAEKLATAGGGRTALLRIRLARLEMEPPTLERTGALVLLQDDANSVGMTGVARTADRAAAVVS